MLPPKPLHELSIAEAGAALRAGTMAGSRASILQSTASSP
jgi:hypothetical protein